MSFTVEIVTDIAECEGHHIDLFLARARSGSQAMRYCDDCAVRLRGEIRRAMGEAMDEETK